MNKLEINQNILKKILESVKHSLAHDESRPILKHIYCKVEKNKFIAYSLDGYRASRVTADLGDADFGNFTFFLDPLPIKETRAGIENAEIILNDDELTVEVFSGNGKVVYYVTQPSGEFIDVDKIFSNNEVHDREIYLNPRFIVEAAKSIRAISSSSVIIETKNNPVAPIILKGEVDTGIINEQLILPQRMMK